MLTRRHLLLASAALPLASASASAASPPPPATAVFIGQAVFDRLVAQAAAEGWHQLPLGTLMGRIAVQLLGTPYVAHTLELDDTAEPCVVNLEGLDCVTFFENTLNLARVLRAEGPPTPAALLQAVQRSRYRGGVQDGYVSRLHYTTDWIWDNARRGLVKDLAPELPGAAPFAQQVGFMSAHPEAYRQLHAHPEWALQIRACEQEINARYKMFVPLAQVAAIEPLLQTGDIIGVATNTPGIDIAHTGLCFKDEQGVAHFIGS
jgi:hypothetical protein